MSEINDNLQSVWEWRDEVIYSAWKDSSRVCEGCPNRQFREGCYPQFGAGNADASVMIVGHAPAKGSGGLRRVEDQQDDPDYTAPENYSHFGYNVNQLKEWSFTDKLQANLFDVPNPIGTGLEEIYYTNILKCHAISGGDNAKGRNNCSNYFTDEVELVNPSVILGFGKGVEDIATRLGISLSGSSYGDYCQPSSDSPYKIAHYRDGNGRIFIPAPHFSYVGSTVSQYEWWNESPPGKVFYDEVRKITNEHCPN